VTARIVFFVIAAFAAALAFYEISEYGVTPTLAIPVLAFALSVAIATTKSKEEA
jgi:hypothetical protein